ncbi:MAG: PEGA domain-containing protein [Deltaproteobacteria bacterium]|nr:PEGA domain-containing protein [Deltaproteobacteria bacterium]
MFAAKQFTQAYDAFKTSYKINPALSALYNMAMCEQVLGFYVESITSFRKLIRDYKGNLKPEVMQKARHSIDKLMTLVGALTLNDPPDEAALEIDGTSIGMAPFEEPIILNPGQHSIEITAEGYMPLTTYVTIAAGSRVVVQASLRKIEATVEEPAPIAEKTASNAPIGPGKTPAESVAPVPSAPRFSNLLIAGLCTAGLGAAGIVVGGIFTYRQGENINDADRAAKRLEDDDAYDYDDYYSTYLNIKDNRFPSDDLGMKIGYIAGGTLIAAGIVLIAVDAMLEKGKTRESTTVYPTVSGLGVAF